MDRNKLTYSKLAIVNYIIINLLNYVIYSLFSHIMFGTKGSIEQNIFISVITNKGKIEYIRSIQTPTYMKVT